MLKPAENESFIQRIRFRVTSVGSLLLKKAGVRQHQLIVCGYPRGGTSLLYNMLASTLSTNFKFTEFEKYFIHLLHKLGNIASKAPLDIINLEYLDRLNIHKKEIALIVVIRDIREVITSKHPIYPDDYFIGFDGSYWPQDEGLNSWSCDAPGVLEVTEKIREAMGRDDVLVVRYEDLVSDPDRIQSLIKDKFNYDFSLPFSQYHMAKDKHSYKYEGKYKPKDSSLVLEGKPVLVKEDKWRQNNNLARVKEQFEQCDELFSILIEFGYETDRKWFDDLTAS